MAPSKLGDQNSKGSCRRKLPLFSERLKAIHSVVKTIGRCSIDIIIIDNHNSVNHYN